MQVGYEPASLEEFFNDFDDDNFLSEGDEDDLEDVTRDHGLRSPPPPASTHHSTAPPPSGYAAVSYPKSLTRPPPPSPLHSNTTPAPPKR